MKIPSFSLPLCALLSVSLGMSWSAGFALPSDAFWSGALQWTGMILLADAMCGWPLLFALAGAWKSWAARRENPAQTWEIGT